MLASSLSGAILNVHRSKLYQISTFLRLMPFISKLLLSASS